MKPSTYLVHRNRNLLVLHLTVFIWGFTGILGALISIGASQLVWYRLLIAFISLGIWLKYKNVNYRIGIKAISKLFLTGAIVGLHWILFFFSIKASTVSVTLVCLSSLTLFTAILEPIINRRKIAALEIITGGMIIAGICLIFKFESEYSTGIVTGLLSALCASLFSVINSKHIQKHEAGIISFYELTGAWFWLSIYLLSTGSFNESMYLGREDLIYLFILGTFCTSVAYVAGVSVMKELSAFRVALITNLEPLYGIILAFIFFGKKEQMSVGFYGGSLIIISAIFLYPYLKNKIEKRKLSRANKRRSL